jgi:hypothetical protein
MSRLTPPTPAPRLPLADLVATLEAMREAGWVTTAPEPAPLEATSPTGPHVPAAQSVGGQR